MPRRHSIPSYRLHRPSGQAVVTLTNPGRGEKDYYLGPYKSPESRSEYARLLAEWTAAGRCLPHAGPTPADLTVNELMVRYWAHVEGYYRDAGGKPTAEVENFRLSLRPLKRLYGHTQARDFGPLALKAVRQSMIDDGLPRKVVNQRVGRIRRCFKWVLLFFLDLECQVLRGAGRPRGDVVSLLGLRLDAGPREDNGLTYPRRFGGDEPDWDQ